jgi:hypothetical protein
VRKPGEQAKEFKMKYAIIAVAAIVSLLGVSSVQAQMAGTQYNAASYTFIEAAYQGAKFDTDQTLGENVDGNGGRFEASVALHPNIYILGTYEHLRLDDLTGPPVTPLDDLKNWSAGLGFNTRLSSGRVSRDYRGLTDRFSLFMDGQYISADSGDFDGFAFDAGLRAINYTNVEFIASMGFEKIEGLDSEFTIEGRLLWRVWKDLQLQLGADVSDSQARWFLGFRVNAPGFSVFK